MTISTQALVLLSPQGPSVPRPRASGAHSALAVPALEASEGRQIETDKPMQGTVRLDSLREIAANKVAALVGRAEPKDLVDLRELLAAGADLALAVDDARRKEGSADPGTLAWLLSELTLGPGARLPPGISAEELLRFRDELVPRLRSLAFEMARRR